MSEEQTGPTPEEAEGSGVTPSEETNRPQPHEASTPGGPAAVETSATAQTAESAAPENPPSPPPESLAAAPTSEEQKKRSHKIKIGSQRADYKPVRRAFVIQEIWKKPEPAKEEKPPATKPPPAITESPAPAFPKTDEEQSATSEPPPALATEATPRVDLPPPTEPIEIPRATSEDIEAEMAGVLADLGDEVDMESLIGSPESVAAAGTEIEPDTRRRATVVKIHGDDVFFSLGSRSEGVASLQKFKDPPGIGDALDVIVRRFNNNDGLYEVSVPGASVSVAEWADLDEGVQVEAMVTGSNKGGLDCQVGSLRGFIPASQISIYRVENFEEFVGQKLTCVVTEANPEKRNLVLSRRAAIEREREEAEQKLWEELEVGQVREGVVRKLMPFGAFVDIGGADGLVHVSQLAWDRVDHPSEVLKEGERIQVKVEKIDTATRKIGLSYRDLIDNPWNAAERNYPAGAIVRGTISRLMDFGAFVKLEPGVEGLCHVSELAHHRVVRPGHVVSEGQEVEVKVLSVDPAAQRMSLSIKQAGMDPKAIAEAQKRAEEEAAAAEAEANRGPSAKPKHKKLKGGLGRSSGGEGVGLNW